MKTKTIISVLTKLTSKEHEILIHILGRFYTNYRATPGNKLETDFIIEYFKQHKIELPEYIVNP